MRYHLTPVSIAIKNDKQKIRSVDEDVAKLETLHSFGGILNQYNQPGKQYEVSSK